MIDVAGRIGHRRLRGHRPPGLAGRQEHAHRRAAPERRSATGCSRPCGPSCSIGSTPPASGWQPSWPWPSGSRRSPTSRSPRRAVRPRSRRRSVSNERPTTGERPCAPPLASGGPTWPPVSADRRRPSSCSDATTWPTASDRWSTSAAAMPLHRRATLCTLMVAAAGTTDPEQLQDVGRRDGRARRAAPDRASAASCSGWPASGTATSTAPSPSASPGPTTSATRPTTRDLLLAIGGAGPLQPHRGHRRTRTGSSSGPWPAPSARRWPWRASPPASGAAWGLAATAPDRCVDLVHLAMADLDDVPALTRLTLPGSAFRLLAGLDPQVAARGLLDQLDARPDPSDLRRPDPAVLRGRAARPGRPPGGRRRGGRGGRTGGTAPVDDGLRRAGPADGVVGTARTTSGTSETAVREALGEIAGRRRAPASVRRRAIGRARSRSVPGDGAGRADVVVLRHRSAPAPWPIGTSYRCRSARAPAPWVVWLPSAPPTDSRTRPPNRTHRPEDPAMKTLPTSIRQLRSLPPFAACTDDELAFVDDADRRSPGCGRRRPHRRGPHRARVDRDRRGDRGGPGRHTR